MTVRYEAGGAGLATIALNQPETRNALSDELLDDPIEAFELARDDDGVRCVVLTSTYEKVFTAGKNLKGFVADVPLAHKFEGIRRFPELLTSIRRLGTPTICAANGHVLAGALGLALACDLVIAKDAVRFGTPEIDAGVFPFMIMALIHRHIGRKRMAELLLLGEQIRAEEAERIGLVNRVVGPEAFDTAVADWAQRLAGKSPLLMRLGKDAVFRQQDMALADALEFLRGQLALAFATEDTQASARAFREKRNPVWRGR